jgi:hypothetical protein
MRSPLRQIALECEYHSRLRKLVQEFVAVIGAASFTVRQFLLKCRMIQHDSHTMRPVARVPSDGQEIEPISFWRHLSRSELHTLELLWSGLCHLYRIVKDLEHARIEQGPKAKDMMLASFDFDCGSCDPMLLNYFFRYACSADSFFDLFSTALDVEKDADAKFAAVRKFRNKVAAHLSRVQPGKGKYKDNREIQSASLRQYITWNFGRYSVGREITGDFESGESSPADWGWELTAVHEELDARWFALEYPRLTRNPSSNHVS